MKESGRKAAGEEGRADGARAFPGLGGTEGRGTALTRGQRFGVGGIALVLVTAAIALVVFSLRRPSVQEYSPTRGQPAAVGDSLIGPVIYTVDASSSSDWTFFDFSRGSIVDDPGPTEWDLAFQRFYIVANGGGGLAGRGGLQDLGAVDFNSVEIVPPQGYVVSRTDRDTTNAATAEWYDYSFTSHLLTPRPRTYAVRTADGRYAKFEILGYYCPGARPGCLTFRYVYQGAGGRRVEGWRVNLEGLPGRSRVTSRDLLESTLDLGSGNPASFHHDPAPIAESGEILEGIRLDQDQVGSIARSHSSEIAGLSKLHGSIARHAPGGGEKDFVRRDTRLLHELHLPVHRETGDVEEGRRVGTQDEPSGHVVQCLRGGHSDLHGAGRCERIDVG